MHKTHIAALTVILGLGGASCQTAAGPQTISPSPGLTPRRVVSLVPSATELIFAVGGEASLVGVTLNDTYPPQVERLPKVGDQNIDAEKLLSLEPDLVVLDVEFNSDLARYRRLGVPVLALESKRLEDIPANLTLLGERLGLADSGRAAASRFEASLAEIPKLDLTESVFIEIWGSPLMTVGGESLPNDLLVHLGLENSYAEQTGYFQVEAEDVIKRAPKIIILPSSQSSDRSKAAELLSKAGVTTKVIHLDGDLFTNPSPRVLQGLQILVEELASMSQSSR